MHVRGHVAPSKASEQWKKILQQLPADVVADILALELSTGKYQSVPMCEHCGRYGMVHLRTCGLIENVIVY